MSNDPLFAVECDAPVFKPIVDAIREILTEVRFEVSPSGIRTSGIDASHVSFCSVKLPTEFFKTFVSTGQLELCVSTATLHSILRTATARDIIVIGTESDKCLVVELKGDEGCARYEIPLINMDAESIEVPVYEEDAVVSIDSKAFQRIVQRLAVSGAGQCTLEMDSEGALSWSARSIVYGAVIVKMEARHSDVRRCYKGTFGLDYMVRFLKATPLATHVEIGMCDSHPLRITYELTGGGNVTFYLAPALDE